MKGFMGKAYDSVPARIIRDSESEHEATVELCRTLVKSSHPVNLLAGSDDITMLFLEAILNNDKAANDEAAKLGRTNTKPREFFVDCEEACCRECVQTGQCGQGRASVWSMAKWYFDHRLMDGGWRDPGAEIICPESHNSEFKKVAGKLTQELMAQISHITITTSSRDRFDPPTFCSALQNVRTYIPNPLRITIKYGDGLPLPRPTVSPDLLPTCENIPRFRIGSVLDSVGSLLESIPSIPRLPSPVAVGALQVPYAINPLPELRPNFLERRRMRSAEQAGTTDLFERNGIQRDDASRNINMDGSTTDLFERNEIQRYDASRNFNLDGAAGAAEIPPPSIPRPHPRDVFGDLHKAKHHSREPFNEKTPNPTPEKEESNDNTFLNWLALCLLLIMNWPSQQRTKVLTRWREQRMEWKIKIMVWRLENRLPRGRRIKHVGGYLGNYLWQDSGRRWWQ